MLSSTVRAPARLVLPLVVLAVSAPVAAQQTQPETPQQREHVVRKGDTLWDLARFYLGNPFLWPRIFDANRQVVENPHWIYPAERLIIPPILQQPLQLTQPIGEPVTSMPTPPREPLVEPPAEPQPAMVETIDLRRPIIPIAEYLAVPWVSSSAEREIIGRIVQRRDPAHANDRLSSALHPTDRVYIGELAGTPAGVGDSLVVVRFGRAVDGRGRVIEPLAVLRVDSVSSSVLVARFARQIGETRIGDVVLLLGALPEIGLGHPEPVAQSMEGQLLQFFHEEPLHGTTDIAFISLGNRDGVGIGDEFAVYVPARDVSSDQLPPTDIATVRVVKVGDATATVRVLSINSTALRAGLPVRLIRKMP